MILKYSALAGAMAGVVSIVYFLALAAGINPYVPFVASISICAAIAKWLRLSVIDVASKPPVRWLLVVFLIAVLAAVSTFIWVAVKQPHGYWDAWSIWNLHARFLERGGAHWTDLFTTQIAWSHPDYPLLVPAIIAQVWSVLHSESTLVPTAVAFFFTFGTVALLVGAVRMLRGWDQALIAGTVLLGTATFLQLAVWQYADVPVGFFMIASLALMCVGDPKCTVLAGALAGCAAWTKNEGLLFLVAVVLAIVIASWRNRVGTKLLAELKRFAIGLAPVIAVVAFFKLRYAPPGDMMSRKPGDVIAHLVDPSRWVTVIQAFVKGVFLLGTLPNFIVPIIVVLVLFGFLVRFKADPDKRLALHTIVIALVLTLIGDFAVYLLLSNDPNWQLGTSLDRVLMQLWPAALLAFFAVSTRVELAVVEPPKKEKEVRKPSAPSSGGARKAAATRKQR